MKQQDGFGSALWSRWRSGDLFCVLGLAGALTGAVCGCYGHAGSWLVEHGTLCYWAALGCLPVLWLCASSYFGVLFVPVLLFAITAAYSSVLAQVYARGGLETLLMTLKTWGIGFALFYPLMLYVSERAMNASVRVLCWRVRGHCPPPERRVGAGAVILCVVCVTGLFLFRYFLRHDGGIY